MKKCWNKSWLTDLGLIYTSPLKSDYWAVCRGVHFLHSDTEDITQCYPHWLTAVPFTVNGTAANQSTKQALQWCGLYRNATMWITVNYYFELFGIISWCAPMRIIQCSNVNHSKSHPNAPCQRTCIALKKMLHSLFIGMLGSQLKWMASLTQMNAQHNTP